MDREQLMGHGHIVERGLREELRSELGELLAQGLQPDKGWPPEVVLVECVAEHPTARGLGCMLSTRAWASWLRGASYRRKR